MHKNFLLIILFLFSVVIYGQDREFSYQGTYKDEKDLKNIAERWNKPLLVTADKKVYTIGSDCISRLLDGNINDRNKSGSGDERNKGGDVGYRSSKGKKNKRDKNGDDNDRNNNGGDNDRDKNGDDNDRDKNGDMDTRNSDGTVSNGPRCSTAKNGKVLLYTRQDISSKNASIYYKENFFNNKYFKIIKL
jgi:hypothetical protein